MTDIYRRRFLVGASGAVFALPWLESLWGGMSFAQTANPPKRFVLVFHPHGTLNADSGHDKFSPAATGTLPATGDISPILAPLNAYRNQLHVLTNIDNYVRYAYQGPGSSDGHRPANTTCITGAMPQSDVLAGGPSIDNAMGALLQGGATRACMRLPTSPDPDGSYAFFSQ